MVEGPYARRKFWQNFTVAGGKVDEKGQSKGWNISKSAFRAMIDSALGLNPKDDSAAAKQKRVIHGLKQLDGISLRRSDHGRAGNEHAYKDANKLANVVTAGRTAVRGSAAWRERAARAGQRQAAQGRDGRHGAGLGDAGAGRAGGRHRCLGGRYTRGRAHARLTPAPAPRRPRHGDAGLAQRLIGA